MILKSSDLSVKYMQNQDCFAADTCCKKLIGFYDSLRKNEIQAQIEDACKSSIFEIRNPFSEFPLNFVNSRSINNKFNIIKALDIQGEVYLVFQWVSSFDAIIKVSSKELVIFSHFTKDIIFSIISNQITKDLLNDSATCKLSGIIVSHERPYHYFYDIAPRYFNSVLLSDEEIDVFSLHGGDFFDIKELAGSAVGYTAISSESLNERGCIKNEFFVKIGTYTDKHTLNNNKESKVFDSNFDKYVESAKIVENNKMSICVNISNHKRQLINLKEILFDITNYYISNGYLVSIVFDGWTSPITPLKSDKISIQKENELIDKIVSSLDNRISYISVIGETFIYKLKVLSNCNLYFGCAATASMIPSRFLNLKSIVHHNYLSRTDMYGHGEDLHVVPKRLVSIVPNEKQSDPYRIDYSINRGLFYNWFVDKFGMPKSIPDKSINLDSQISFSNDVSSNAYLNTMAILISEYKSNPSKKNAGKIARHYLDNPKIDLSFRSEKFLDFIIYLEEIGDIEFAVKMTKHFINQGAYKTAVNALNNILEKRPESKFAVNELKNIYYREAINFWRTGKPLYGLGSDYEDIYSATYRFISLLRCYKKVLDFNDHSLISQVSNAFLMLSTNSVSSRSVYVEELLDFSREIYRDGYFNITSLHLVYYDIFVWFGHFSIGNVFRQKAVRAFLEDCNFEENSLEILLAHAECGLEMSETRYLQVTNALARMISQSQLNSYLKYYRLNTSTKKEKINNAPTSSIFGNFLRGKSVAIIGPYDDGRKDGDEIDGFDIVIRINNFLDILPEEGDYIGNRTDVGYFTHQMLSNIDTSSALENIKFIRLRNGFGSLSNSLHKELIDEGKITLASLIPRQLYKGASVIQTIIFDIIDFEPSRIKLFKMNFYLEQELYSDSYKKNISVVYSGYSSASDLTSYRSVFFAHDFVPQFMFTKNLFARGYIEANEDISQILKFTLPNYMNNMELSHKVIDRSFLSSVKYIENDPICFSTLSTKEINKQNNQLLKKLKSQLRIFDFAAAYVVLQQLKQVCDDSNFIKTAQHLYDFNWLSVSMLFQRNWNIKLESPRTLVWSDVDKLYDVRLFEPAAQLSLFMQLLDYEESFSRENTYQLLEHRTIAIESAVGLIVNLDSSASYSTRSRINFACPPESAKQAFARFDLLQWLGDFENAYVNRQLALKLLKDEKSHLSALVEIERKDLKGGAESIAPTGNVEFDLLMNGSIEQFYRECQLTRDENDLLNNLISGKNVAIVGPAPTGEETGDEIDSYDVVIRFNYTGSDSAAEFGSKTTMSAYNKLNSIYFERFNVPIPFENLEFYFVKEPVKSFDTHIRNSNKIAILPRIPFLLHKSPMATLDMLYFLIKFNPKSIKIFKHTLLLSAKTHADSYGFRKDFSSEVLNPLQKLRMTLSGHDLLSHHALFRHFYSLGLFEADIAFKRVLNLTSEEFSDELQRIYSK